MRDAPFAFPFLFSPEYNESKSVVFHSYKGLRASYLLGELHGPVLWRYLGLKPIDRFLWLVRQVPVVAGPIRSGVGGLR